MLGGRPGSGPARALGVHDLVGAVLAELFPFAEGVGKDRLVGELGAADDSLAAAGQLLAVAMPAAPGTVVRTLRERPSTPLSDAALLTNATGEPGVGHEIRAELASADRVDVIMAFVKWYGLRLFEDRLRASRERGVPLRLITTTYMGATERAALDRQPAEAG